MCDTQINDESTITSTVKPAETLGSSNELVVIAATPPDSPLKPVKASNSERVRRRQLLAERYGDEHLSNQKKQRYWNSWEELYIVELWNRYKEEVTIINVPLPVYRKMMAAMRSRNMVVNTQDCRRKINTLNARYKQELIRMKTTGCKSDWRLFPLIHCILEPKIKDADAWHETKIIKKLLDKLPKPVEELPPPPPPPPTTTVSNSHYQSKHTQNLSTTSNAAFHHEQHTTPTNEIPLPGVTLLTTTRDPERHSILPFRYITMEKIEQLREDNNRLAAQRDDDLKRLHMEEENFRCFENFIRIWTEQKELELIRLQLLTQENVKNLENGESHTMEQQLHDTVVTE